MPKTTTSGTCSPAENSLTDLHPGHCDRATLEAACHQYLELRSQVEGLELERNRLALKLGQLNLAIANQLGPLERPMVVESQGMLLVINVAEGLIEAGRVTATVTEAMAAGDVLDDAPAEETQFCGVCGSPEVEKMKSHPDFMQCRTCLSSQKVVA